MKLKNKEAWDSHVKINKDSYGKACVDTARRVMEILDDGKPFDCHEIVCQGDKESGAGGISGFMAGCVASMVSECHERGEEFRKQWNLNYQIKDEGEKANKGKDILNPALMSIETKEGD